jgi:hypothetical protein
MAKAGRKRKEGPRYTSGELKRVTAADKGTEQYRLQRAFAMGGLSKQAVSDWTAGRIDEALKTVVNPVGEGVDAIGRAYVAGFLVCDGIHGAALRDAGRVLFKLYWSHYAELRGMTTSALYRAMVSGGAVRSVSSGDARDHLEGALNERLDRIGRLGRDVRRAVESLCIDQHFDAGPAWLDRLIAAKTTGMGRLLSELPDCEWRWPRDLVSAGGRPEDFNLMQLAVRGLAEIA